MAEQTLNEQEHQVHPEETPEKMSLRKAIQILPSPLQTEVLKRFGTALLALLVTIVMVCMFRDWTYCGGLIISLLAVYLGLDIIWKYVEGKIHMARMVVCKAMPVWHNKNQVDVILRDASIENLLVKEIETYKFQIGVSRRNRGTITAGTVMDVYVSESAPHAVLAYEILGEIRS